MQRLGFVVVLWAALAAGSRAGDFKLPADNPIASITIPAAWNPSEHQDGVEATSDDGSVHFAVKAADISDGFKALGEATKYLDSKGVTRDADSLQQSRNNMNGMTFVRFNWDGKDGAVGGKGSISVINTTQKKEGLLLTCKTKKEEKKKHEQNRPAIEGSNKQIGRAHASPQ